MILKINLIAFYQTIWREKRGKEGDLIGDYSSIFVRKREVSVETNDDGLESCEEGRHIKTDKHGVRRVRDKSQLWDFKARRVGEWHYS